jgi:F-type H+-transporting ATPase subunit b
MELLKLLSTNEIVAQALAFLILLAIMRSLFWKKFLAAIDSRRARIGSELKAIEEARAEVEVMKAGYEERLTKIEEEAEAKFGEAAAKGKKLAEEVRLKAEHDGERILQNARENIRGEVMKAREELKDSIVDLAINAAEKVIEEKLTEAGDRRIVEEFLKKVEKP